MGKIKENLFEVTIVVVGGIGLILLFTGLYNAPSFIIGKIIAFFHIKF